MVRDASSRPADSGKDACDAIDADDAEGDVRRTDRHEGLLDGVRRRAGWVVANVASVQQSHAEVTGTWEIERRTEQEDMASGKGESEREREHSESESMREGGREGKQRQNQRRNTAVATHVQMREMTALSATGFI